MLSASRAASRSRGSLAFAIALALLVGGFVLAPLAQASPTVAPSPADVLSITLLLDKSSYVSGDNATATVVVYRTPGPANYTYTWLVEDFLRGTLATLTNGTSSRIGSACHRSAPAAGPEPVTQPVNLGVITIGSGVGGGCTSNAPMSHRANGSRRSTVSPRT